MQTLRSAMREAPVLKIERVCESDIPSSILGRKLGEPAGLTENRIHATSHKTAHTLKKKMVRQDSPHAFTVDRPVTGCAFGLVAHHSLQRAADMYLVLLL